VWKNFHKQQLRHQDWPVTAACSMHPTPASATKRKYCLFPATLTACPLQHPLAGCCQRMEGSCLAVSFPRPQYSHCAVPCSRHTKPIASLPVGHCHAVPAAATMFQMLLCDSVKTCQVISCCRPHTIFVSTSHPPTHCCCCSAADAVLAAVLKR
jgi:hypothetical protein